MCKSKLVIEKLIDTGFIPEFGEFDITEDLVDNYQSIYKSLYEKVGVKLTSGNRNYARKLAGIFLMKENQERLSHIEKVKIIKSKYKNNCGIVYVISNPSFPNSYKVGMTKNLESRLKSYQTYDPNRQFKVEHYRFVEDARLTEKKILADFKFSITKGEWIKGENIKKHFIETVKNV